MYKEVGKHVRALRKAAKLTQFELAELAEINPDFVSKIERAQSGVSFHTLERIASALNVPLRRLIEGPAAESKKGATSADAYRQRILFFLRKKNTQELKAICKILEQVEMLSKMKAR